jgi:hypothetical protein
MFRAALVEGNLAAIALWGAARLAGGSPNISIAASFCTGRQFLCSFRYPAAKQQLLLHGGSPAPPASFPPVSPNEFNKTETKNNGFGKRMTSRLQGGNFP